MSISLQLRSGGTFSLSHKLTRNNEQLLRIHSFLLYFSYFYNFFKKMCTHVPSVPIGSYALVHWYGIYRPKQRTRHDKINIRNVPPTLSFSIDRHMRTQSHEIRLEPAVSSCRSWKKEKCLQK